MSVERDPRLEFSLKAPKPLVSFCLFTCCVSSPPLTVLKDVSQVDEDIRRSAINYLSHFSYVDSKSKTAFVPDVVRFYWRDFGGNRNKVLQNVAKLTTSPLRHQIEELVEGANAKPRVNFIAYDWNETIIL